MIVLIDESTQRLRTFATYPKPSGTTNAGVCTNSGGAIYEKSTPLDNISFTTAKTARIVDADQYVHNVTSTKQNLNSAARGTANSGLLVLADVNATSRYWHYYDSSGGGGGGDTTAPTVTGTSPAAGATGVAVTANVTGTFSEAMDCLDRHVEHVHVEDRDDDGVGSCDVQQHGQRRDAEPWCGSGGRYDVHGDDQGRLRRGEGCCR